MEAAGAELRVKPIERRLAFGFIGAERDAERDRHSIAVFHPVRRGDWDMDTDTGGKDERLGAALVGFAILDIPVAEREAILDFLLRKERARKQVNRLRAADL